MMKNCEPLVFGPALAIDRVKGRSCRRLLQMEKGGRGCRPATEQADGAQHERTVHAVCGALAGVGMLQLGNLAPRCCRPCCRRAICRRCHLAALHALTG